MSVKGMREASNQLFAGSFKEHVQKEMANPVLFLTINKFST